MALVEKNMITLNQKVIFSSRSGNLPLLKERVEQGGDVNYFDEIHSSPIIAAIANSNLDVIDYLISKGVDLNVEYHDAIGPLEIALKNPVTEVVYKLICAGAKLKKKILPYYQERLENCLKEVSLNEKGKKRNN